MHHIGINKKRIFSLSIGHLVNDWYMNIIQSIIPIFVAKGLSVSKGAFLVTMFTITSSLLQPIFGYLADKKRQHWLIYCGTAWMAILLGFIGFIDNYYLLIILVAFAGMGTAAFHPQASALTTASSGTKKGFYQAIFIASGNVGWAFTPLIAVPVLYSLGLEYSSIFVIPGLVIAVVLYITTRNNSFSPKQQAAVFEVTDLKPKIIELSKIMLVVAFRSLTYFSMVAFLPLYLQTKNISLVAGSRIIFLMLFSGAIGGLIGGFLSDKYGRKLIISVSLICSSVFFLMFTLTHGLFSIVLLAIAGALLLASFSVTVITAQEIMKKNAAMISGLMLGFGTGIGGIGVSVIGIIVEQKGILTGINILVCLPMVAGLIALFIKSTLKLVKEQSNVQL